MFSTETLYNQLLNPSWRNVDNSNSVVYVNHYSYLNESTSHTIIEGVGTLTSNANVDWSSSSKALLCTVGPNSSELSMVLTSPFSNSDGTVCTVEMTRHVDRDGIGLMPIELSVRDQSTVLATSRSNNLILQAGDVVKDWITFTVPGEFPGIMSTAFDVVSGDELGYADIDIYVGTYQPYRPDFSGLYNSQSQYLVSSSQSIGYGMYRDVLSGPDVKYVNPTNSYISAVYGSGDRELSMLVGPDVSLGTGGIFLAGVGAGTTLSSSKWVGVNCYIDASMASNEAIAGLLFEWTINTVKTKRFIESIDGHCVGHVYIPKGAQSASASIIITNAQSGDRLILSQANLFIEDTESSVIKALEMEPFDGSSDYVVYLGLKYRDVYWEALENQSRSYFRYIAIPESWSPTLVWSKPEEKQYELGLNRGVIFVGDQSAVWNGLVSVEEDLDGNKIERYFMDGFLRQQYVPTGSWQGKLSAFTAPSIFALCDGHAAIRSGFYAAQQPRSRFSLIYQTHGGDGLAGHSSAYKLHFHYDLLAASPNRKWETVNSSSNASIFEWPISALPFMVDSNVRSGHFWIDSREVSEGSLEYIKSILYGDGESDPRLLTPLEIKDILDL